MAVLWLWRNAQILPWWWLPAECLAIESRALGSCFSTQQWLMRPTTQSNWCLFPQSLGQCCLQKSACVLLQGKVIKSPLLACFTQKPATSLSYMQEKWSVVSWRVPLTTAASNSFSHWYPLKILGCCSSTPPLSGHYLKEQSWQYCLLCML